MTIKNYQTNVEIFLDDEQCINIDFDGVYIDDYIGKDSREQVIKWMVEEDLEEIELYKINRKLTDEEYKRIKEELEIRYSYR